MSEQHIHIITHDVPYPADFGGVIDVFYKIKALSEIGVKIILHCFTNKRAKQNILEEYCESVTYYPRRFIRGISFNLPYIVASRNDKKLLENLKKDNYPVLFEAVHTTFLLFKNQLPGRKLFVRIFNVENIYYSRLALHEKNILKRLYYSAEAKLLKKYEKNIANKTVILALSSLDKEVYQSAFNARNIIFLPCFLPYHANHSLIGTGKYCLYHGNLQVNENEKSALWLIENIFSTMAIPLVIAGCRPSKYLIKTAKKFSNISIVDTPSEENMQLLITHAQINILPSFNNTGVKLKLLNALFKGRHCIVNEAGTEGSGLNELCTIAETADSFKEEIARLFVEAFSIKKMQHRSTALKKIYNNEQNALIFSELLS